jgi:HAD superfamily hydrolase (TIGR01509 family)
MPDPGVSLVVFDLGGVIVRICRSWAEGCRAAGLPVRGEENMGTQGMISRRRDVSRDYQEGRIDCEEFFRRVAETTEGLYSPDEIRRVHDAWTLDEYPGVNALVRSLKAAEIATGVLSNTNHAHWVRLAPPSHLDAAEYPTPRLVDHLHASHLMGLSKPNPEIYHRFAELTGYQGRERELLFFDDLEDNIAAARAVGWRAVQVDHAGDTASQMAHSLREHGLSFAWP